MKKETKREKKRKRRKKKKNTEAAEKKQSFKWKRLRVRFMNAAQAAVRKKVKDATQKQSLEARIQYIANYCR